ncbi:DUF4979 domain-containing protein [Niabella drilacis]|uniref:IPT/TIG domain-containing protein n=1 Tax=Niabella drilacis (strain DSM 25811 / CCM 8410 / CCUG 62505 / LMG 26954 / E90) TaxID=1285928 RepID=A0A1G6S7H1_NIADE|nr:DUF4979 domain-containing protein [Niabella drilacis]SDD12146.1 IPT/TIG domain-containing protein [Niabella drilacis]
MQQYNLAQRYICGLLAVMLLGFASCEKGPDFREFNYPAPVIDGLSPAQGYVGSDVTITGADFGNLTKAVKVYFGGVLADTIRSVEDNKIVVQAPENGVSGVIRVEIFGKADTSGTAFTYLPSAKFIAVSADKAMKGDKLTITGENFGTDIAKVQLFIGANEAQVTSVTSTQIEFVVPDVPSGTVYIVVDGQRLTGSYLMVGMEKLTGTLIGHTGSWSNSPATTIAAAVDGDIATYVDAATASGFVGYDMGVGKAAVIKSVRFVPRNTFGSRMVNGEIRGANDPALSDAVTLYTVTAAPPSGVYTEVAITNTESYRYIYYYAPAGNCNIAAIEFYGNVVEKADPVGKYIWEFLKEGDNEGWVPQQSASWTVSGGALNVTFPQTSGNKRADLAQKTTSPVVVHTGTFPVIAIKMIGKPEGARITFDTNLGSFGNGYNKYATEYAGQNVYYWDMAALSIGAGAPRPNEQLSFTTFQFKIADIPQADPATGYKVEWIRTFESKEKLAAFLGL